MIRICYVKKTFSVAIPLIFFILALTSGAKQKQNIKKVISDVTVYNQDGERLHFYSDLIKGKVVAINFIFTSCTYICPMQGAAFSKLQAALGDRLGRDVHLISVSIDPATDTSERLKAWGQRFGAKPGWTFVTGERSEIDKLLESLTGSAGGRGEHSPIVLIGNDEGAWIRAYGLAEPERYIDLFEKIREGSKQIPAPRA
jgi:protein SCO1/2